MRLKSHGKEGIACSGHELSSIVKDQIPCSERTGSPTSTNKRQKHPVMFYHLAGMQNA